MLLQTEETILILGSLHRSRTFLVVVSHGIDPGTHGIAPHQPSVIGLVQHIRHRKILRMEFFQLHHPPDVTVLSDRKGCEEVADYLEVDDHGHE